MIRPRRPGVAMPPQARQPRPWRASAVALWAGLQTAALAATAGGVHLWPHHPDPPESLAVAEMVAVQVVAAALLFPVLFADGVAAAVAIAITVPFDALAALLSATPTRSLLEPAGYVILWMVGLTGWARAIRRPTTVAFSTAVTTAATICGGLLLYGRAETAATAGLPSPNPTHFGPLTTAIALAAGSPADASAWIITGLPLIAWITPFLSWVSSVLRREKNR